MFVSENILAQFFPASQSSHSLVDCADRQCIPCPRHHYLGGGSWQEQCFSRKEDGKVCRGFYKAIYNVSGMVLWVMYTRDNWIEHVSPSEKARWNRILALSQNFKAFSKEAGPLGSKENEIKKKKPNTVWLLCRIGTGQSVLTHYQPFSVGRGKQKGKKLSFFSGDFSTRQCFFC